MPDILPLTDEQKEGAKFLDRDFSQCFQQMRHYDAQIVDICKFAFTGYIAVAGAALALYKYGVDKGIDYTAASVSVLTVAGIFGLMLLGLAVRNRVYFVLVTRYVNEHRRFFLREKPLGFANESRMYPNPALPPYFSWLSSQAWLTYTLALLNSAMLTVALVLLGLSRRWPALVYVVCGLAVLTAQLVGTIAYLVSRERKSPSGAVWGRE